MAVGVLQWLSLILFAPPVALCRSSGRIGMRSQSGSGYAMQAIVITGPRLDTLSHQPLQITGNPIELP